MPFFSAKEDKQCAEWVRKLYAIIVCHNKLAKRPNLKVWSSEFSKLRKAHTAETVESVLKWYCENFGNEFVPVCWSAATFREKFLQIKRAMDTSDDVTEAISPRNGDLAKRLMLEFPFPPEIAANLPLIVQRTRQNWESFCARMKQWVTQHSDGKPSREEQFMAVTVNSQTLFVEDWVSLIGQKYGRMSHYTGPALSLAFKPESKAFVESFWRKWAFDWSGNPRAFDSLLDQLLKGAT